jgi:hypothetical protein
MQAEKAGDTIKGESPPKFHPKILECYAIFTYAIMIVLECY